MLRISRLVANVSEARQVDFRDTKSRAQAGYLLYVGYGFGNNIIAGLDGLLTLECLIRYPGDNDTFENRSTAR